MKPQQGLCKGGTKKSLSVWHPCAAGICKEAENLSVPKSLWTGIGAIRQGFFLFVGAGRIGGVML